MATRQQMLRAAEKVGAMVEFSDGGDFCVETIAPDGKTWSCDPGLHILVTCQQDGESMSSVYQDMLDRITMGLQDCVCEECKTLLTRINIYAKV